MSFCVLTFDPLGMPRLNVTPRLPRFLAAAAVLLTTATLPAQSPGFSDPARVAKLSSSFDDIDRVFRTYAEREHIPGAVWGIVIDGKLAHVGVTGYRDVSAKSPVDSGTVFRIASMTKSFTALAILKLRDEGRAVEEGENWRLK